MTQLMTALKRTEAQSLAALLESLAATAAKAVFTLPEHLLETLVLWQARDNMRRHMASLDARLLDDVGLDRRAVEEETSKPIWRA